MLSDALLLLRAMLGVSVLKESVRLLLESSPSMLKLPELEKARLPTSIVALPLLSEFGVNVAV